MKRQTTRYLLDTNICVFLLKDACGVKKRLDEVGRERCFVSEITLAELYFGAAYSGRKEEKMKEVDAVIGGEGNGGVIYPPLHYGRDALVGIALFLSHFAHKRAEDKAFSMTAFRASFPAYSISKNRVELKPGADVDKVLASLKERYRDEKINEEDGVRIDFEAAKEWVQIRKSNTEPIMRVYAESVDEAAADALGKRLVGEIEALMR